MVATFPRPAVPTHCPDPHPLTGTRATRGILRDGAAPAWCDQHDRWECRRHADAHAVRVR